MVSGAWANGVLPMFNPIKVHDSAYTFSTQGFMADDPVSLHDFFNDWEGEYTPEKSDNYAFEFLRVDIGKSFDDGYYVGYFYQRDVIIKTNRGFVDAYYIIKNDLPIEQQQDYELFLAIYGIIRHGIVVSRDMSVWSNDTKSLHIGFGAFVSYDTDMQHGTLSGEGSIYTDNSYDASGYTSYYYMDNLLYDLDVKDTYGLGYGTHFALLFEDKEYNYSLSFNVNDLFSYTHWKNLPYSLVNIETQNQEYDGDYVSYNPTISGWELYKDFTQKIEPKYNFEISKTINKDYSVDVGVDYIYEIYFPYIKASRVFDDYTLSLQYEFRYETLGFAYSSKYMDFKLYSNGFADTSAVGFSLGVHHTF